MKRIRTNGEYASSIVLLQIPVAFAWSWSVCTGPTNGCWGFLPRFWHGKQPWLVLDVLLLWLMSSSVASRLHSWHCSVVEWQWLWRCWIATSSDKDACKNQNLWGIRWEQWSLSVVSGKMEIKSFGCHLYTYTRSGYMGHVVQSLKSNKHKYIQTKDTLDY